MRFLYILLIFILKYYHICTIYIETNSGVDLVYSEHDEIISADFLNSANIYIFVVKSGGQYHLKSFNRSDVNGRMLDLLNYPVNSAKSIAIDWIYHNVYWTDNENKFIEVVSLIDKKYHNINYDKRRIIIDRKIVEIDSLVIDPIEQYLFWLQTGAEIILERSRFDGTERQVIYRSVKFKSHNLAIDRHRKMLYWFEMDNSIRRVDYQGRTGCQMYFSGDWSSEKPRSLIHSKGHLLFLTQYNTLWSVPFNCQSGSPIRVSLLSKLNIPLRIVLARLHQNPSIQFNTQSQSCNMCWQHQKICLPSSPEFSPLCLCSTGIISKYKTCAKLPNDYLLLASPPRIYQISLDELPKPPKLMPILENTGIPYRMAVDSSSSSLFFIDLNSSSIKLADLSSNHYSTSYKSLVTSRNTPLALAYDISSHNLYWIERKISEIKIGKFNSIQRKLEYISILFEINRHNVNTQNSGALAKPIYADIVVDEINHFLFILVIFSDADIFIDRYCLDGSHKKTLLSYPIVKSPRGLAVDNINRRLFTVDLFRNEMLSIDYDGNQLDVLARGFKDFFHLSFLNNRIYWTDLETLSVHSIEVPSLSSSNSPPVLFKPQLPLLQSSSSSSHNLFINSMLNTPINIVRLHNFRATALPLVAISTNYHRARNDLCSQCKQLCFPLSQQLFGKPVVCGCSSNVLSDPNVIGTVSSCNKLPNMILLYNSTTIMSFTYTNLTHFNSKHFSLLGDTKPLIIYHSLNSDISSVQIDKFRSVIYWIDSTSNCIIVSNISLISQETSRLFCVSRSESMTTIELDALHNNLYVNIHNRLTQLSQQQQELHPRLNPSQFNRLILLRLPFPGHHLLPQFKKTIGGQYNRVSPTTVVGIQLQLKYKLLFQMIAEEKIPSGELTLYSSELDGNYKKFIWRGLANKNSLTSDKFGNSIYWLSEDCEHLFEYYLPERSLRDVKLPQSELCINSQIHSNHLNSRRPLFVVNQTVFLIHSSKIQLINLTSNAAHQASSIPMASDTLISEVAMDIARLPKLLGMELSLVSNASVISHVDYSYTLNSGVDSRGLFRVPINCPNYFTISQSDQFQQCHEFCLPTSRSNCGCIDLHRLIPSSSVCTSRITMNQQQPSLMLILASIDDPQSQSQKQTQAELVIDMSYSDTRPVFPSNAMSLRLTNQWIESVWSTTSDADQIIDIIYLQHPLIDSIILLKLNNAGYVHSHIMGTYSVISTPEQPMLAGGCFSIIKQLQVETLDDVNKNSYEKVYRHLIERQGRKKSGARYKWDVDRINGLVYWADWVNGVIAVERIRYNSSRDGINNCIIGLDHLGVVVDFRRVSRRPLEMVVGGISGTLVWVSGDLAGADIGGLWRDFWIEMSDGDGSRRVLLSRRPYPNHRPSHLVLDEVAGIIYWMEQQQLHQLKLTWNKYVLRAGHLMSQGLPEVHISIWPMNDYIVGKQTSSILLANNHLLTTHPIIYWSHNNSIMNQPIIWQLTHPMRLLVIELPASQSSGSISNLIGLHPCNQRLKGRLCSQLCLSTLPLGLDISWILMSNQHANKLTNQQQQRSREHAAASSSVQFNWLNKHHSQLRYRCSCIMDYSLDTSGIDKMPEQCVPSNKLAAQCLMNKQSHCRAGYILPPLTSSFSSNRNNARMSNSQSNNISSNNQILLASSCFNQGQLCDNVEDCLDGSDESYCGQRCNTSHPYSCSWSHKCLPLHHRCDGLRHCESDELCCSPNKFECLAGPPSLRCLPISKQCDGIRDCNDGSDEYGCTGRAWQQGSHGIGGRIHNNNNGIKLPPGVYGNNYNMNNRQQFHDNNHTVAIVSGVVGALACSAALTYIIVVRHCSSRIVRRGPIVKYLGQHNTSSLHDISDQQQHHHYHHESCVFRTNNLNMIMLVNPSTQNTCHTNSQSPTNQYGAATSDCFEIAQYKINKCGDDDKSESYSTSDDYSSSYQQHNHHNNSHYSNNSGSKHHHHRRHNCNLQDRNNYKHHSIQSLTSLSECYRRIRQPPPLLPPPQQNKFLPATLFPSNIPISISHGDNATPTNQYLVPLTSSPIGLARPLFTSHDDPLLMLLPPRPHQHINSSIEKLTNPPPSLVTYESDSNHKIATSSVEPAPSSITNTSLWINTDGIPDPPRNSIANSTSSPSYISRDQLHNSRVNLSLSGTDTTVNLHDYPTCVLEHLLSACHHHDKHHQPVRQNHQQRFRRRRRRLNKYRRHTSLNHQRSQQNQQLFINDNNTTESNNELCCPPPPSPTTVVSM